MLPASVPLKDGWTKQEKQGRASSWTDPPSPRPPRWVFWLVRPHKVSNEVSNVNSNCPIHTATPDTTQTGLLCRVWRAVVWIGHETPTRFGSGTNDSRRGVPTVPGTHSASDVAAASCRPVGGTTASSVASVRCLPVRQPGLRHD